MSEQIDDRTLSALQKLYEAAQELEQLGYRVTVSQESNYPPKMGDTYTVFEVQNTYRRNDNNELVPVGHGFTLDGKPGKVVMSLRAGNPFHYTIGAAGENISDKFHQVMKFLGNLQPLSNSYLFEIPDNPYMRNRNNVEAMRDGLERMRKLRADLGTVPKELSSEAQEMLEAFRTNCKLKPSIFNGIMARNSGVRKSDICQWAIRQLMEEGMDHTAACRCVYGGTFGDDSEMTIGEEGVKQMVDLINNPPPPNDTLKKARQKYLSQCSEAALSELANNHQWADKPLHIEGVFPDEAVLVFEILTMDPWDPTLTTEQKERIIRECCINRHYYLKTVAKLTVKADADSYIWTEGGEAKFVKLQADIEAMRVTLSLKTPTGKDSDHGFVS